MNVYLKVTCQCIDHNMYVVYSCCRVREHVRGGEDQPELTDNNRRAGASLLHCLVGLAE
jgi:hypothetical protein